MLLVTCTVLVMINDRWNYREEVRNHESNYASISTLYHVSSIVLTLVLMTSYPLTGDISACLGTVLSSSSSRLVLFPKDKVFDIPYVSYFLVVLLISARMLLSLFVG